jgi:hypothetical protein
MSLQNCKLTSLLGLRLYHTVHHQKCSSPSSTNLPMFWMVCRDKEFTSRHAACTLFPQGTGRLACFLGLTASLLIYQGLQVSTVEKPLCSYGPELPSAFSLRHLETQPVPRQYMYEWMATGVRCWWSAARVSRKRSWTPGSSQGGTYSAQVLEPSTGGCPFQTPTGGAWSHDTN